MRCCSILAATVHVLVEIIGRPTHHGNGRSVKDTNKRNKMADVLDHLQYLPPAVRKSKPTLLRFNPIGIPYQMAALKLIRKGHDYSKDNLQILLSGSYGSAKSVLLAHLAVTHCLMYPRARVAIVRKALPDLKETLFREILETLEGDQRENELEGVYKKCLLEGRDYFVNRGRASIKFRNGSEIVPIYWADKNYKRPRSKSFSMILIEEGTENREDDKEGFDELVARLGRLNHVPENVLVVATNPDAPSHWLYDYFIGQDAKKHTNRHVFYSRTEDNPYLPRIYIQGLRKGMDPKRARRYLDGEWIELNKEMVYYAYSTEENFRPYKYVFDPRYPIRLSWDFNIGIGKPLSMIVFQFIDDVFHFGTEVVVEGMRTLDSLEELADRGILDLETPLFIVNGDAAGKHKDTRNLRDDYSIIVDYLSNYKRPDGGPIRFEKFVPLANPTIRSRHNRVNAYCFNKEGERRLFVYEEAPTLHKGLRLVALKKGSDIMEDDSKHYQHVTTAAGYGVKAAEKYDNPPEQRTRVL